MSTTLTLNFVEAERLIRTCGHKQSVVLEGAPGIGKTSIGRTLSEKLGMPYTEFDCATKIDGGNISIPWISGDSYVDRANEVFAAACDTPTIICFDEIGKANKAVIAAITPILRDRRLLERKLHPETIVYATSNNRSDNVGDNIPAHIWNAVTSVQMRNPTAEEWVHGYANKANISPEVIAWVIHNPHCMAHYSDYKDTTANPLIFDPREPARRAYVSPRSLARASIFMYERETLGAATLQTALAGTLGPSAAHDLVQFAILAAKLPTYAEVVLQPEKVDVPAKGPAQIISALNVANRATAEKATDMQQVAKYVRRLAEEVQALFVNYVHSGPHEAKWSLNNRAFTDMVYSVTAIT